MIRHAIWLFKSPLRGRVENKGRENINESESKRKGEIGVDQVVVVPCIIKGKVTA